MEFLHQSDTCFVVLTLRKTLDLRAYLQLARGNGAAECWCVVDGALVALELTGVVDWKVGDRSPRARGNSSGGRTTGNDAACYWSSSS